MPRRGSARPPRGAPTRNEDADTARGLALSLKRVGAFAEAETVAYAWRDRDPQLRALYVDIAVEALASEAPPAPLSEARLARLSQFVLAERSVRGARALGWHRYRTGGFGGQWLRLAVDWSDAAKRDAKTDEGLGLSLRADRRPRRRGAAGAAVGRQGRGAAQALRRRGGRAAFARQPAGTRSTRTGSPSSPRMIEPIKSPLGAQALGLVSVAARRVRLRRALVQERARLVAAAAQRAVAAASAVSGRRLSADPGEAGARARRLPSHAAGLCERRQRAGQARLCRHAGRVRQHGRRLCAHAARARPPRGRRNRSPGPGAIAGPACAACSSKSPSRR